MIGAILGDIVGSPYEFDQGKKSKDFEFISNVDNFYTDDSVMTVAIAEALMEAGTDASVREIKNICRFYMKEWGSRYPNCGYGARFCEWLMSDEQKPYGSWGNGSAMRVSPVGWMYDSLKRTREVARATAAVTHNHPEGLKGAEATASAIFMARTGKSRADIKRYIESEFGYDLDRTLDEIRPDYHHDESCMRTVPEAIIAFLESTDYVDAVRNAVSLGGDTDTLAAITGSIAEAFYGIDSYYREACLEMIEGDMRDVVERFEREVKL